MTKNLKNLIRILLKLSRNKSYISSSKTKYLEKLNKENEELVFTRKVFVYDLKPDDESTTKRLKK